MVSLKKKIFFIEHLGFDFNQGHIFIDFSFDLSSNTLYKE